MTPIVKVAIGLGVVVVGLFAGLLLMPATQQAAPPSAVAAVNVKVDEELAQRGSSLYGAKYGCTACHAVSSLKVSGSTAGPDLSRAVLGEAPAGTRTEAHPLPRWYQDNGLVAPANDLDKATKLFVEFLEHPPAYSPMMQGQVQRLVGVAGGEEQWERDVKAMTEFLKKAAGTGGR